MLAGVFCLTPPLLLHLNQLTDLRFMTSELSELRGDNLQKFLQTLKSHIYVSLLFLCLTRSSDSQSVINVSGQRQWWHHRSIIICSLHLLHLCGQWCCQFPALQTFTVLHSDHRSIISHSHRWRISEWRWAQMTFRLLNWDCDVSKLLQTVWL